MRKKDSVLLGAAILAIGLSLVYLLPSRADATTGINQELSFEGKIVNASGLNITDGNYNVEFNIYTGCTSEPTSSTGCTSVWTEDYLVSASKAVTFTSGTFQVNLGSITAFGSSVNWNTYPLYLSIQIGNTSSCTPAGNFTANCGGDGVMNPYVLLTSTPYALNAGQLGGIAASGFVQLQGSTPGSAQTGNFNISGTGIAGTLQSSTVTSGSGDLTIQAAGANSLLLDTASYGGTVSLGNNNTTTINIGANNNPHTIGIGSGGTSTVQTITAGSTYSTSTLVLQGGTGTGASAAIKLVPATAGDILIGASAGTGTITLGQSTASNTINIGSNLGASNTQTINVGTSASGTTNLLLGSTYNGNTEIQSAGGLVLDTLAAANNTTYLCRNSSTKIATCNTTGTGAAFIQGGNSFGSTAILGTNDNNALQLQVYGTGVAYFDTNTANAYFGNAYLAGGVAATPNAFTLNGTGSSTVGTAGAALSVVGGAGATATTGSAGGAVTIKGGSAGGTGNNAGGNLTLEGGASTGSGTAGSVIVKPQTDSTTAFQVQNAAGTSNLFVADTTDSRIGIGTNAPEVGLQVSEANFSSTYPFNTLLTDTTATAQGVGGGIGFSGKIDGTTTDYTFGAIQGYKENGTTSNDAGALHFLTRPNGGNLTQVLSLGSNGAATFQNSTNSTTAFQVQNAATTALLTADTTNLKVTTIGDVNVGNRYGNRLFSDNFESGGFGLWSGGVTGSATTVQTTTVHAGKYAAEFNPSGSVNYVSTSLNSSNATKYVRFWANVTSATTSADFAEFYAGATQLANVYYQQSTSKICIYNQVSATTAGCTTGTYAWNTWHQVEMQATVATSTTGTLALWVDGVQAFTSSTQNLGTTNIDSMEVGENATANTNTFFIDDLSVDTVSNGTASSLNVDDSLHVGGTSTFGNSVLIQPASNSTTAFQVQNAAGATSTTYAAATTVQEWDGYGTGLTTLSIAPHTVGNLIALAISVGGTSYTVSSISGGGVSSWTKVNAITTSSHREEIWEGTVTSTGSGTITVTYSATPSVNCELAAQEFTAGLGTSTSWSVTTSGTDNNASSNTVTYPTLTAARTGELYWGFNQVDQAGSAGSTPGFTYTITANGNIIAYDPNTTATSYTPTASQSPAGTSAGTAMIIAASVTTSSGGIDLLSANTTTGTIQVGSATSNTNTVLLGLNNYSNGTTEPTVINGAIYYNSALNAFRCGLNSVWVSCIGGLRYANTDQASLPAGDTITNTTTNTAFADYYTIPANDCTQGRVYRIDARGTYTEASTATSVHLSVYAGATVVAQTSDGNTPTASKSFAWEANVDITCTAAPSASSLLEADGLWTSAGQNSNWNFMRINNQAASVDTTTSQTLKVYWQWGTANASTVTLRQLTVEALGP